MAWPRGWQYYVTAAAAKPLKFTIHGQRISSEQSPRLDVHQLPTRPPENMRTVAPLVKGDLLYVQALQSRALIEWLIR